MKYTQMKRFLMFLALVASLGTMAQEGPKISSAILADRDLDIVKAKTLIDEVAEIIAAKPESEVSYKSMRKFLYYNGKINLDVASSEDAAIRQLDDNALEKAEKSLKRSISYEEELGKSKFSDKSKVLILQLAALYANQGLNQAANSQHAAAYKSFLKTYELRKESSISQTDTSNLYNAAIMAQNAKMFEEAIKLNKELIELGYKGYEFKAKEKETGKVAGFPNKTMMDEYVQEGSYVEPEVIKNDLRPGYYMSLANLSMANGDTAMYSQYVSDGRAAFPDNSQLLTMELDVYIRTKAYDKALVNLNQAIEQNPDDKQTRIYYYNKGIILHTQMDKPDEALPAYSKAIELDSGYADAWYMHGLVYYDKAKAVTEEMNDLPLNAKTKYNNLKKQQQEFFKSALPYFEGADQAAPNDKNTLLALAEVYRTLKMNEKAIETSKKVQELE
jgi:tetratricopeptide (TPR) repeat protein